MGKIGPRRYVFRDDYSDYDDMEAGYDEIEEEEQISRRIGNKEDAEALKQIKLEEEQERRRRIEKKKMKRRREE